MAKQTARKGSSKRDDLERARRKLAKLELKLEVANEEQLQADVRGKQEVEQARLRAAQWQTKAAEKLERRRQQVARAEARLAELTSPGSSPAQNAAQSDEAGQPDRAERALHALRDLDSEGATLSEWSRAADMSRTTLSRARNELVRRGLIEQNGVDGKAPRYALTGRDA